MNRTLRISSLIIFGFLVMGVGLAAELAGLSFYHMYKNGKLDAFIASILYVVTILTLFSFIMAILTAFYRKFAISLISSIMFYLSFIVYFSFVIIYFVKRSIIVDITKIIYSEKFDGIYQKLEEHSKCCGYDAVETRCSQYTQTCGNVISNGIDHVATPIVLIIMTALSLAGAIFATLAAHDDRRFPISIGNDEAGENEVYAKYPRRRPCMSDSSYEYVEEEEYIYEEDDENMSGMESPDV